MRTVEARKTEKDRMLTVGENQAGPAQNTTIGNPNATSATTTPISSLSGVANRPGNFNIRPDPHPEGRLVTGGPYAWVRHPMYLAVLLAMAAFALGGDAWQWAAWVALAAVLAAKALREEKGLADLHPGYGAYRARTRAIIPFVF